LRTGLFGVVLGIFGYGILSREIGCDPGEFLGRIGDIGLESEFMV